MRTLAASHHSTAVWQVPQLTHSNSLTLGGGDGGGEGGGGGDGGDGGLGGGEGGST